MIAVRPTRSCDVLLMGPLATNWIYAEDGQGNRPKFSSFRSMSYLLPELCDEYNVVRTKNDPHTTCDRATEGVCTLTLVFVSILPTRMVLSFSSWFGLYDFIRVWGHVSAHVSRGFESHSHIRHSNVLWFYGLLYPTIHSIFPVSPIVGKRDSPQRERSFAEGG